MKTSTGEATAQQTQTFPRLPQTNLEKVVGYDVIDREDHDIGDVTAIWADQSGQPAFLGIKTAWIFGKTHVVPAYGAQVNHAQEHVRIGYLADEVKNAPCYDPDAQMDLEHEYEIYSYYRGRGPSLPDFEKSQTRPADVGERKGFETGTAAPSATTGQHEETRIPLHEESMKVGKREVEAGGIRLRKIVRTETVNQPVELKHEDVVIERVPASGTPAPGTAFQSEDIYIPLRQEEVVVDKETRVREEVRARKTSKSQRETISGTTRTEDVEVQRGQGKTAPFPKGKTGEEPASEATETPSQWRKAA